MASTGMIEVKLRVLQVDERNGRHIIKTDSVPSSLAPHVELVEMRRTSDPVPEIFLFYHPFLGMVNAVEGEVVPFKLDLENFKLSFAPLPEFYLGDSSITLTSSPAAVHRLYKPLKRKGEDKLYWCVDLEKDKDGSIKKKAKFTLLDVTRLCKSSLSLDKMPCQDSWPGSELYLTMKPSKLAVALPKRSLFGSVGSSRSNSNSSITSTAEGTNRTSPRSASSTSDSIFADNDNTFGNGDHVTSLKGSKSHLNLSTRFKHNMGAYEDGMFSYGIESTPYI